MSLTFSYRCYECGRSYSMEADRYLCDDCSQTQHKDIPLKGLLETCMDVAGENEGIPQDWLDLKKHSSRPLSGRMPYADARGLLPVPAQFFPSIPIGDTPLWQPERLRKELKRKALYFKDDTANPTGSLKDRASYLIAAFARQMGIRDIVAASTGNAGSSIAGIAAAAELNVRLYLPASAPPAKIAQSLQYGANVIKIDGSYTDAYRASLDYLAKHGGLSRITGHNPLTIEGKKTVSLEIFQQLGAVVPDVVYVSTGDGVIISGVYKGFEDLLKLGLSERMPKIVCVQAEGSSAIHRALAAGDFYDLIESHTVADSISVDVPLGGYAALRYLQKYNDRTITVSDEAILEAQKRLSSSSGLFAEPAASAAFAGYLDDIGKGRGPGRDEETVILITGNGLKDIQSAMRGLD